MEGFEDDEIDIPNISIPRRGIALIDDMNRSESLLQSQQVCQSSQCTAR